MNKYLFAAFPPAARWSATPRHDSGSGVPSSKAAAAQVLRATPRRRSGSGTTFFGGTCLLGARGAGRGGSAGLRSVWAASLVDRRNRRSVYRRGVGISCDTRSAMAGEAVSPGDSIPIKLIRRGYP